MKLQENNIHKGHRQRVKERFEKEGLDSFSDHNVLEMLLFYSIPQRDTNEIAHSLLEKFGSFDGVFDADTEELTEVQGISNHSATLIKVVGEAWKRYSLSKNKFAENAIDSVEKAGNYCCTRLMGSNSENFLVICLNSRLNILSGEILFEGTVNRASVDIRKISEYSLKKKAASIIVAHNHPTGYLEPSADDITLTAKIADALKIFGIDFADHIICCGNDYFSMAQSEEYGCFFN